MRWRYFWTLVLGIIMGMFFDIMIDAVTTPQCPQEDSCSIDYHDGEWHITEEK